MGMTAILVMWFRQYEQIFVSLPHGGPTRYFVSFGPVVIEMMSFENFDDVDVDADTNDGRWTTVYSTSSPPKPSALVSQKGSKLFPFRAHPF